MEAHQQQIAVLLAQTLSPHGAAVAAATEALGRISLLPDFPFSLLYISTGNQDPGLRISAATYLKNYTRKNIQSSKASKEFKDTLLRSLLVADSAILKILIEAFRAIVASEFVKENSWPELVPELRAVIPNSDLLNKTINCEWKTINVLTVLQSLIKPFQYFMDPKLAKEPVPPQLELIAQEILVPLLDVFHQNVEKLLSNVAKQEEETEKLLLISCKCMFLAVRSHMPSSLSSHISSFCTDLFKILNSLSFNTAVNLEDSSLIKMKIGKRSLLIFSALVTRHRKVSDKLMPNITKSVLEIVKHSANINKLDFLSERVISLAFDVVSRILETGPGWRQVSPHFASLLKSAIFPALLLNDKDTSEWEEDADEYIRKNLPSELEEISGWKEDLFTARKSALNLLGVMSMSKGPPAVSSGPNSSFSSKRKKGDKTRGKYLSSIGELLVLPFLSKFPLPSDLNAQDTKILNEYYGVLMAYGSLQDFLCEQKAEYSATIIRTRVLPIYKISTSIPYLIASANWVLGELASCLSEEMSAEVYSSLLRALNLPDMEETSCYPVWVSAAGAITELLENDYFPPEWLPLLQVVVSRIAQEGEETAILFELLGTLVEAGNEHVTPHIPYIVSSLVGIISKCIPHNSEPWPQMVERGFAALAVMVQCWEDSMPDEDEERETTEAWVSGRATIAQDLSSLLQQAWLTSAEQMEEDAAPFSPPPSCIDDSSALLRFIMQSVTESNKILKLKLPDLLIVWANLISSWHAWEETEDISIFNCIKEAATLHQKFIFPNFLVGKIQSSLAIHQGSIIKGISDFVKEAFSQYPSVVWRASSCVHLLLHVPSYKFEDEVIKQALVVDFSCAAFSRFKDIKNNPCSLWKPLLLALSSCYLAYPEVVERILEKEEDEGFIIWANALCSISSITYEHSPLLESEIKLIVITLAKVVERLLTQENLKFGLLQGCFTSLLEASVRFKESQEEGDDEESGNDEDAGDEDTEDDDDDDEEDSDEDEREETEEEFLERYAKAAVDLENGTTIEEGDVEDLDQELELGELEGVDPQSFVLSLIKGYHQVLVKGQSLPQEVISSFVDAFPECDMYFKQ